MQHNAFLRFKNKSKKFLQKGLFLRLFHYKSKKKKALVVGQNYNGQDPSYAASTADEPGKLSCESKKSQ